MKSDMQISNNNTTRIPTRSSRYRSRSGAFKGTLVLRYVLAKVHWYIDTPARDSATTRPASHSHPPICRRHFTDPASPALPSLTESHNTPSPCMYCISFLPGTRLCSLQPCHARLSEGCCARGTGRHGLDSGGHVGPVRIIDARVAIDVVSQDRVGRLHRGSGTGWWLLCGDHRLSARHLVVVYGHGCGLLTDVVY